MGSSKIQEYNLDPNMGLAKESSVQSVLSAVESIEGSVVGAKKYIPSTNILCSLLDNELVFSSTSTNDHIICFESNFEGYFTINITTKSEENDRYNPCIMYFYSPTYTDGVELSNTSTSYLTISSNVFIKKGEIIQIILKNSCGGASKRRWYKDLQICGTENTRKITL